MAVIISPESALVAALLILLSVFASISIYGAKRTGNNNTRKLARDQAPKPGGAWPLIGHLHLLAGSEPAHRVLGHMADKYGPIFTVKLGMNQALVVSNWELANECFTTNDRAFAYRPKTMAMELLGYNFMAFPFSQYGQYWRQSRKITTVELLSNQRLEKLKHIFEHEVKGSIKKLYENCRDNSSSKVLVEMKHWLEGLTLDIILSIMAGKSHDSLEGKDWQQKMANFVALLGKFVVSDALPFLRWLDIGGDERLMKKTAKEFDMFLQECLDEHKMKRASGQVKGDEDFIYVLLSLVDGNPEQLIDHDADTVIKSICLTLMIAGSETTTTTMTWAISLLLNNRDVLKKAQAEVDTQVGTERQVNVSDMKNLVYLHAIIKETMRLYPAAPLFIPHECREECTVGGYHVPIGTQLFVNAWKIHHDPRVWEEASEFKPERFLTTHKDTDYRGKNPELIPFGSGRRICPGISFGIQVVQLVLASLLHGFDLETPSGEKVDMGEGVAITIVKAAPLEVALTPRLAGSLYG